MPTFFIIHILIIPTFLLLPHFFNTHFFYHPHFLIPIFFNTQIFYCPNLLLPAFFITQIFYYPDFFHYPHILLPVTHYPQKVGKELKLGKCGTPRTNCYAQENWYQNVTKSNQIWIVIALFRSSWHQTEFHLVTMNKVRTFPISYLIKWN